MGVLDKATQLHEQKENKLGEQQLSMSQGKKSSENTLKSLKENRA